MYKKIFCLSSIALVAGCTIFPGVQNPHFLIVPNSSKQKHVKVNPKFIPINPDLILDHKVSRYVYRVSPTDVLQINVWQHPEFNFTGSQLQSTISGGSAAVGGAGVAGYLVNPDGKIYFPLIGEVFVADKTVDEVRKIVAARLKEYVPNPQLNVRVAEFRGRKIYVLGEVKKSGFLPVNDQQMSITQALALSDWFDQNAADTSHIFVIRGDITAPNVYWLDARTPDKLLLAQQFHLQPNDILYVSSAPVTNLNRAINQILPTIQAYWFTKAIVQQPF